MNAYNSKCLLWKKSGAEYVREIIEKLNGKDEIAFWEEQTLLLKKLQSELKSKPNNRVHLTAIPLALHSGR